MDATERIQIESHLKALAICHYIWGGLICFSGCFGLLYVGIGLVFALSPDEMFAAEMARDPNFNAQEAEAVGRGLGVLFTVIGCVLTVVGAALGICAIMSGRYLAAHRNRLFSQVIAGISCASIPLGTILGVFTFVILNKPAARELYAEAEAAERSRPG